MHFILCRLPDNICFGPLSLCFLLQILVKPILLLFSPFVFSSVSMSGPETNAADKGML